LVLATPGTRYIGAHAGCLAEDLGRVGALMDRAPNWSIDVAGRLAELGRQPRRFAALVAAHPDRVLFGTDVYPPQADDFRVLFRFLETADEDFDYAPGAEVPPQGRWTVSGAALPTELLEAVYAGNAERVLGL
jgi:predicted TIM-barrel fold metal-dependent hydrolase